MNAIREARKLLGSYRITHRDCALFAIGAMVVLAGIYTSKLLSQPGTPLPAAETRLSARWLPDTVTRWEDSIAAMAARYNVDPNLIGIIITMESGGYSQARSEAGAQGLMQIMPGTAQDIASKFLKQPRQSYDIMDPATNIEFGTAYLAYLRDEFGNPQHAPTWNETVELIAAGYNGGPGSANKLEQGKGLTNTQPVIYSRDAFNMWRERFANSSPTFDRWQERGGSRLLEAAKTEAAQ